MDLGVLSIELVGDGCAHLCKNEAGPEPGLSFEKHQYLEVRERKKSQTWSRCRERGRDQEGAWQHLEALGDWWGWKPL